MWEKIKALLAQLGIDVTSKEKELKDAVDKLEKDTQGNIDLSKLDLKSLLKGDEKANPLLETLIASNNALMQEVKDLKSTLGKELTDREAAIKAQQDKAKADAAQKVQDAIKKALETKKIVEADKPLWETRLTKDFDEWNKELDAKPIPKQFQKPEQKTNTNNQPQTTGNSILDAIAVQNQNAVITTE
jgi:regulator of replication initiation timing